jgi:NhaC family Na+:H+ antiporter
LSEEQAAPIAPRPPSMVEALIPVVMLVGLIFLGVVLYGGDLVAGPVQVALIFCAIVAGLIGVKNGQAMEDMGKAAVSAISMAIGAIFILLSVGALIGTWNMSGTVATMVHWGIQFLDPNWFYLAAAIVCGGIALGIGSAWTVIGTMGVALIAIGTAIGVSPLLTAGAVISGSYFGDQISPLSETTNLAPAVTGTNLYAHIKAMIPATTIAALIALGMYGVIGMTSDALPSFDLTRALDAIESVFYVGVLTLIPLLVVILMAIKKVPPTIAILSGALAGGIVAIILQPDVVLAFVDDPELATPLAMLKGVWSAMATGFYIDTGIPGLDAIVSGGGMEGMLSTVWLIMSALAFGGIMEYTGSLARLIEPFVRRAKTAKSMVATAGLTAIGVNMVAADQYLAIVLSGRMFKQRFEEMGIAPQTLSKQIEESATVTSPLIPWNSCGAYVSATLGIATFSYLPFCFFNLITPVVAFVFALMGWQIERIDPEEPAAEAPEEARMYGIGDQPTDPVPSLVEPVE